MVTRKMLINESHKYFTNVSFHISTIRGVEPNNILIYIYIYIYIYIKLCMSSTKKNANICIKSK